MGALTDEQIADWLVASCQAQGVPVAVTDPAVVGRVAVLLTGRARRNGRSRPPAEDDRSPAPHGLDAGRVEPVAPGPDDGVVEDGLDDGALTVEVEVVPLAS
jgi:hypothetical protein